MSAVPRPGWSIYRRLVISVVLAIGGAVGALFFVMDYWVDREVHAHMDQVLLERGRTLAGALALAPAGTHDELDLEFFSLYSADGRLLRQSGRNAQQPLPLPDTSLTAARHFNVRLADGRDGRAVALPVHLGDHGLGALVLANDREGWDRAETRIHWTLLLATVVVLALVSLLAMGAIRHAFAFLRQTTGQLVRMDPREPLQPIGERFPQELEPFARAFNKGVQRLYQALDRERRFSANVAHELRTPLAEIRSSAESALASAAPQQREEALDQTVAATARMQRSVDAMLQLARLESGQDEPMRDPLDLGELLASAVATARHAEPAQPRAVTVDAAACWVLADVAILERILANLLANALAYAEGDGPVHCSVHSEADGIWLQVDNPAGSLQPEDLQYFGQRFWRRQSEGGTAHHAGLGLALSLGLAQAHALRLEFQVSEGRLQARLGPLQPL